MSPTNRQDLKALGRLLSQADMTLGTIPDPHPAIARTRELLGAATKLAANLAILNPAVALGTHNGNATKARSLSKAPEYYKKIAGVLKTNAGGRPKKGEQR